MSVPKFLAQRTCGGSASGCDCGRIRDVDEAAALARADRITADRGASPDPQAEADLLAELSQLRRAHPAVAEAYWLPAVLEDLGRAYERLGRVDDALTSVSEAIGAGLRGSPDPRTVLGEINYRAGRREEQRRSGPRCAPTPRTTGGCATRASGSRWAPATRTGYSAR